MSRPIIFGGNYPRSSKRFSNGVLPEDPPTGPIFSNGMKSSGSLGKQNLSFQYHGDSLVDVSLSIRGNSDNSFGEDVIHVHELSNKRVLQRRNDTVIKEEESLSSTDQDSISSDQVKIAAKKTEHSSDEEFVKALEKRKEVDLNDEKMDGIEWAVRSTVPIPEKYYWDAVGEDEMGKVPAHIKVWHNTIAGVWSAYSWTERWITKPLVGSTGLTNQRLDYVTDFMTKEEWEQSKRTVKERIRKRREWEKRMEMEESKKNDEETGTNYSYNSESSP